MIGGNLGRPSGRDGADRGRRLRLVPDRRAFRRLGRAGERRRRHDHGQSRRADREGAVRHLVHAARARVRARVLGIRRLSRQFAGVPADRLGAGDRRFRPRGVSRRSRSSSCSRSLGRAVAVYPVCLALLRTRWAIPLNQQHLMWWGGLRGALALALALALPADLPRRDDILIVGLRGGRLFGDRAGPDGAACAEGAAGDTGGARTNRDRRASPPARAAAGKIERARSERPPVRERGEKVNARFSRESARNQRRGEGLAIQPNRPALWRRAASAQAATTAPLRALRQPR